MNKFEQALLSVRDVYVQFPKQFDLLTNELRKVDQEIQDMLHVIEFYPLDAVNLVKKCKELRDLRKERRKLKNELEFLGEIKLLISSPKPTEKAINSVIGRIRSTAEKQQNRTYKMRVRKDWQDLLNKKR